MRLSGGPRVHAVASFTSEEVTGALLRAFPNRVVNFEEKGRVYYSVDSLGTITLTQTEEQTA